MNPEQIVTLVSACLAVGCVVYARVKGKSPADVVAELNALRAEVKAAQAGVAAFAAEFREPLTKAIGELPKRRTKAPAEPPAGDA